MTAFCSFWLLEHAYQICPLATLNLKLPGVVHKHTVFVAHMLAVSTVSQQPKGFNSVTHVRLMFQHTHTHNKCTLLSGGAIVT